jgi:hypothetical protein
MDGCNHLDCDRLRKDAATPCTYCKDKIGFERRFYNVGFGQQNELVHAVCHEDAIEEEQSAQRDAPAKKKRKKRKGVSEFILHYHWQHKRNEGKCIPIDEVTHVFALRTKHALLTIVEYNAMLFSLEDGRMKELWLPVKQQPDPAPEKDHRDTCDSWQDCTHPRCDDGVAFGMPCNRCDGHGTIPCEICTALDAAVPTRIMCNTCEEWFSRDDVVPTKEGHIGKECHACHASAQERANIEHEECTRDAIGLTFGF